MKSVRVDLGDKGYEIRIGSGLLKQAGAILREAGFSGKAVVITDSRVKGLYGSILESSLTEYGFEVHILEVPEGEEQKSLETAGRLYQELTGCFAERNTPVLAMGGGVIGDLAGFVAATYMRGVPLVQVPTTLLAQGDSSIGGKVAVNHGKLKNKIGAFHHPAITLSDTDTLKTLSEREISNGLAEIIKHGAILDREFFSFLESNLDRIKSLDDMVMEGVVARSAEIKARVVGKDEMDMGYRNVLNQGHTVGHAIESVSALTMWHGEAVAMGMMAEARISNSMGMLQREEVDRLENLISRAGLPAEMPVFKTGGLVEAIQHDKKNIGGRLRFALLKSIGEVFITEEVDTDLVAKVLVEKNG